MVLPDNDALHSGIDCFATSHIQAFGYAGLWMDSGGERFSMVRDREKRFGELVLWGVLLGG